MWKYWYGPRPRHESVKVTLETEVPPIIPKEARKKQPEKKDFENKMLAIDKKADILKDKMRGLGNKKREIIEGGKVGDTKLTFKEFLKKKLDELTTEKKKKRDI